MPDGSTTHRDTDWKDHHTSSRSCKQIRLWRSTSSSRRPGWRTAWSTAPASIRFTSGYDIENLTDPSQRAKYRGAVEKDPYGRQIPKQAHGSINLDGHTSSTRKIMCAVSELFDRIVDKNLLVRRMYVVANHVLPEADVPKKNDGVVQLDLFTDYAAEEEKQKAEDAALERERKIQAATLAIKKKYGKNAILKVMNLEEGATAKDRNAQIGGHKA